MKQANLRHANASFSALGRAVWDETIDNGTATQVVTNLSVLSVEPYGMKPRCATEQPHRRAELSVLSVEPYGMKQ